jgi:heavy metal efflux system protein
MRSLLNFVIRQPVLSVGGALVLVAIGIWSSRRLPIDAVPDITNVQVQVNTISPALSPLEVEKQITFPVEVAVAGLPRVQEVRSLSKFGLSQVTVVFEDDVDIYFARQLVQQRLQEASAQIPQGMGTPEMGPISTGLGEIYQYTVEVPSGDLIEGRTVQDWYVKPALRSLPGVAEVNSLGGEEKQYQVLIRPESLLKHDVTLRQLQEAIAANNMNEGGGYILKNSEQFVVRGVGQVQSVDQIKNIVVVAKAGVPVRVQDLAEVRIGSALRQGAMTKDGKGEVVTGIVMMLMGSNSRTVAQDARARIEEIAKTLPSNARVRTFYDRTDLVDRTIRTVATNLFEGALLVVAVLFLMLGNFRAALIVALAIPLSLLFAISLMLKVGIAGSLMSLGAIDFGLIVDGSVVMVENAVRRLANGDTNAKATLVDAFREVGRPVIFGIGIIVIVYLPILTLQGVEGKLFKPMAVTVIFALLGSLLLTFTLTPALVSLFLKIKRENHEEQFLLRKAKIYYEPLFDWSLAHKRAVLLLAAAAVTLAGIAALRLGSEFIPRLDENAFALEMRRPPGISLEEANRENSLMEKHLLSRFPDEIDTVLSKTGRAEIATDPMGPESTDFIIQLKPKSAWKKAHSRDELLNAFEQELKQFLGVTYEFSQPIEMRMNELIAGVRSDLAIRIYGDDMQQLQTTAEVVANAVSRLPGARGFRVQQVSGLPTIEIKVLPEKIARYGINAADVMEAVAAISGLETTHVIEGQKRFELVIRLVDEARRDETALGKLLIAAPGGERVPLSSLAEIRTAEGPAEISHRNGSRLILVEGNVRGRDLGSFIGNVRRLFDSRQIAVPAGYRIEFGGQFENLERARQRLLIVVPLSLFLIFSLLYLAFQSVKQAALVFTGIPLAAVGGVLALLLRGMPFSISAGIGFIALFGVAVLNGVVLVSFINDLRNLGHPVQTAVREGTLTRLRPVLMTALVASLGFLPMALSTSAGAEVQRPLATVVIGGLISSTLLTLVVLPVVYELFERTHHDETAVS